MFSNGSCVHVFTFWSAPLLDGFVSIGSCPCLVDVFSVTPAGFGQLTFRSLLSTVLLIS